MRATLKNLIQLAACLFVAGGVSAYEVGIVLPRPDKSGDLVQPGRFTLTPVEFAEETRVVIFFYSASWCAPCRQVAAVLKDQYPEIRKNAPHLEIVTYSVDSTPRARADYLREGRYPWPALSPALVENAPWLPQIEGGTPQFQAFAVSEDSLIAITKPGTIDKAVESLTQTVSPRTPPPRIR